MVLDVSRLGRRAGELSEDNVLGAFSRSVSHKGCSVCVCMNESLKDPGPSNCIVGLNDYHS